MSSTTPASDCPLALLLQHRETERLECKSAQGGFPKSFWETYSAFANTNGGVIALGISETPGGGWSVDGVRDAPRLRKTLWDTINNPQKVSANILFERHVREENLEGKTILVVDVPRAERTDRPVFIGSDVFRGTYRRGGEGDYCCSRESVLAMLRDQGSDTADGTMAEGLSIADLDAGTLRRYRGRFATFKPGHVWNDLPNEEFLLKIGAARRDSAGIVHPTRAGLLCFGEFMSIVDEFPNFFLDYRERLSGETRWSDRVCSSDATWSGNVYDFFFRIHDRMTADVRTPFTMSDSVSRVDDTEVHKALREALANALVHADYFGRQGVVVEKTFRHLVIANPGCLRIRKEVAIAGGTSDARNARLFNIFALVDIGERSGSGLCNIYSVWQKMGKPTPTLQESFDPERTVFSLEIERGSSSESPPAEKETVEKTVENTTEKIAATTEKTAEKATATVEKTVPAVESAAATVEKSDVTVENPQQQILAHLKVSPKATQEDLQRITGLTRRGVEWNVKVLKASGRLRRVGPDRGGHWEVIE